MQPLWLFLLLATLCMAADKTPKKDPATPTKDDKSGTFTFKVPVDVVVVNAIVTDKQGNPVKDLKVDEFRVYEDGKLQPIHTFALESYKATQGPAQTPGGPTGAAASEDPGSSQSRMISIVVDDLATSAPEFFMYAQQALTKLLASGVAPSDLVSFSTASGSVNQPFTSDRDLLLSLAEDLHKKVQRAGTVKSQCPELTDMQAQQIRNNHPDNMPLRVAIAETIICQHLENVPDPEQTAESMVRSAAAQQFEENQHRYRSLLTSLKQYLRSLRHFEGRKSLILISDGFLSDYVRYELQDVTDICLLYTSPSPRDS